MVLYLFVIGSAEKASSSEVLPPAKALRPEYLTRVGMFLPVELRFGSGTAASASWPSGGEHIIGQETARINTGIPVLRIHISTGSNRVAHALYGPLPGSRITGHLPMLPVCLPV